MGVRGNMYMKVLRWTVRSHCDHPAFLVPVVVWAVVTKSPDAPE